MKRVFTENSVYEFNLEDSQVRRISGYRPPTDCFRPDGEWKHFHALIGAWPTEFPALGPVIAWPDGAAHDMTVMSEITHIEDFEC